MQYVYVQCAQCVFAKLESRFEIDVIVSCDCNSKLFVKNETKIPIKINPKLPLNGAYVSIPLVHVPSIVHPAPNILQQSFAVLCRRQDLLFQLIVLLALGLQEALRGLH